MMYQRHRRPPREIPRYARQGNLLFDMLRGYLYFTEWASCYVLAGCSLILLPLLVCGGLLYYLTQ